MMKRKLFFACLLFALAVCFNSCEVLSDCKACKQVTYVDGAWDHETATSDYCGASLLSIETMDDYVNGNIRTTWECN